MRTIVASMLWLLLMPSYVRPTQSCAKTSDTSKIERKRSWHNGGDVRLVSDDVWAALTIMQEAADQPYAGKLAVAEEIRNRTKFHIFSAGSVPSTVLWPYQYSGWNTKDPNRIRVSILDDTNPIVRDCIHAWAQAMQGSQTVPGVTHHYNPKIVTTPPDWVQEMDLVAEIGDHRFYKRKS